MVGEREKESEVDDERIKVESNNPSSEGLKV